MKKQLDRLIDEQAQEMIDFSALLFETPELGFKEFESKKRIIEKLAQAGIQVEKEYFETGFQVTIGQGKPHIGLIAELDAIVTPHHRCATGADQAAHSCGHSTQVAIMVSALTAIQKSDLLKKFKGTLTLFFTPAEEFVDLPYRKQKIKEGKLNYLSGKENMLAAHVFDEVDCLLHLHGMGEMKRYRFNVNSELAGFVYKKFHFKGTGSHAAVLPHLGHNALNAFTLFQSAQGMLRETFVDEDKNRVHGILTHGGDSVNSIPADVIYEAYVRSFNPENLLKLSQQLTTTAKHCALALGCTCEVIDTPGYLPFKQNAALSQVVYENMKNYCDTDLIQTQEQSVAAGDIGDVGCFKPTIQFGYTGFKGTIHGSNLEIENPQDVIIIPSKIVAATVADLLMKPELVEQIVQSFPPTMTMEQYLAYLKPQQEHLD